MVSRSRRAKAYWRIASQLEAEGLNQVMRYPPYNRNYRAIEDFTDKVMARM